MAYDPAKDKLVAKIMEQDDERDTIDISVYQYNGGPKKIRFQRISEGRRGTYHDTLAKMTKDEFQLLINNADAIMSALS